MNTYDLSLSKCPTYLRPLRPLWKPILDDTILPDAYADSPLPDNLPQAAREGN